MRIVTLFALVLLATGCSATQLPPMETVPRVDLARFMGHWYVIAHIPTRPERDAHNAVENYELNPDGTVATTFTFQNGGFDSEPKSLSSTGFIFDAESNAIWGMQFIWPIKADFRIAYLSEDYDVTVIAREKRDYVWVMARSPSIPHGELQALAEQIGAWGYDVDKLRLVPHRWEQQS
jgi:apolipoprotein D and lipocalin family protein